MLHCEDANLVGAEVEKVVHEIGIIAHHQLAHAVDRLRPAETREMLELADGMLDGGSDVASPLWAALHQLNADGLKVGDGAVGVTDDHFPKRRNAAATRSGAANWPRSA